MGGASRKTMHQQNAVAVSLNIDGLAYRAVKISFRRRFHLIFILSRLLVRALSAYDRQTTYMYDDRRMGFVPFF